MTRRDYVLIAGAIKEVYEYQKDSDGTGTGEIKKEAIRVVARTLATALEDENPAFDRTRFIMACGIAN